MADLFLSLLNMSITASWIVLAVLAVRLMFPKAPKWIHCLLWGFVALRLVLPDFFESSISLIPSAQVIPLDITTSQTPAIYSGIPAVNSAVNPQFTLHSAELGLEKLLHTASRIWLGGVAVLLLYSITASLRLRWQIRVSIRKQDNVYLCDNIDSPFVFGILCPRIYLPSDLPEEQTRYVLSHEQAHIRRHDHWWKPLGFLLLTVYWFNPLLWLAYILLCRDIEKACDEKVIAGMDSGDKKGYSYALLACSVHRRLIAACPIAFGEVSVKTRIKGVLNYRRPAFWTILISVLLCLFVAVCFLTNPTRCRHSYSAQITIAPTCTEKGMQTNTCSLCQHCYTRSVPRAEHSYDDGVVTKDPTCVSLGVVAFRCTGCDAKKTGTMPKTAHIAGEPTGYTAANCSQLGHKTATCSHCREVFVTEVLPTNDVHDLTEKVLRQPTCSKLGEGVFTCSRCDYQESCSYEKLDHRYTTQVTDAPTCMSMGQEKVYCVDCGYAYYNMLYPTNQHNFVYRGNGYEECTGCGWRRRASSASPLSGTLADPNFPSTPSLPSVNIDDPFA